MLKWRYESDGVERRIRTHLTSNRLDYPSPESTASRRPGAGAGRARLGHPQQRHWRTAVGQSMALNQTPISLEVQLSEVRR